MRLDPITLNLELDYILMKINDENQRKINVCFKATVIEITQSNTPFYLPLKRCRPNFTSSNLLQTPQWKLRRQHSIIACELLRKILTRHKTPVMLGGHSGLDPPLPISNRAVKRTSANDSMLFACESRSLPSSLYQTICKDGLHKTLHVRVLLFVGRWF